MPCQRYRKEARAQKMQEETKRGMEKAMKGAPVLLVVVTPQCCAVVCRKPGNTAGEGKERKLLVECAQRVAAGRVRVTRMPKARARARGAPMLSPRLKGAQRSMFARQTAF